MDITVTKKNNTNAFIKVKLTPTDYQPKVDEKLKKYSKKMHLKGFREGKIPTAVIQKMYGKEILSDEINHLVSHSLSDYIKEHALPIVGEPIPNSDKHLSIDWENQKDFEFEFKLGLHSEFKYNLSKIKVTQYELEINEQVIKETIQNLQKQFATRVHPEEVTGEDDFIAGNLTYLKSDFKADVVLPLNKMGSKYVKKYIGLKKEQILTIDLLKAFGEDYHLLSHMLNLSEEEVKKYSGDFELLITDIIQNEPAPINQDFFDKVFGKDAITTESDFREKVKQTVSENYQRECEWLLKKEIQNEIIDQASIDLPDDFLKEYLYLINQEKFTKEQIEKEYQAYAEELRWGLVRNRIIKEAGIKIQTEEILTEAKELIKERYMNAGFGGLNDEILDKITDTFLKQDEGKNYREVAERVIAEKTISYCKEHVTIKNKTINLEDFKKKAEKIYKK